MPQSPLTGLPLFTTVGTGAQTFVIGDGDPRFGSHIGIHVPSTAVFTGTFEVDCSNDATTWVAMLMTPKGSSTAVTSATAPGFWTVDSTGVAQCRINVTALSSGSIPFIIKPVAG